MAASVDGRAGGIVPTNGEGLRPRWPCRRFAVTRVICPAADAELIDNGAQSWLSIDNSDDIHPRSGAQSTCIKLQGGFNAGGQHGTMNGHCGFVRDTLSPCNQPGVKGYSIPLTLLSAPHDCRHDLTVGHFCARPESLFSDSPSLAILPCGYP